MEASEKLIFLKLIIYFTCILVLISLGFYWLFLTFKKRIEREQEAMREAEINFEREINEASMKAEQQERMQIAMDLHDDIGAMMTVLKINTNNAKTQIEQPERLLAVAFHLCPRLHFQVTFLFDDLVNKDGSHSVACIASFVFTVLRSLNPFKTFLPEQ